MRHHSILIVFLMILVGVTGVIPALEAGAADISQGDTAKEAEIHKGKAPEAVKGLGIRRGGSSDAMKASVIRRPEVIRLGNKPVFGKTEAQLPSLSLMTQAKTSTHKVKPPRWPANRRWSPLRHFGPFRAGSSLDEIRLVLNGSVATVQYNRFFQNHPDANTYLKYYYAPLPSNQPLLPNLVPGKFPTTGFGDTQLQLEGLSYSSRYGGSLHLEFHAFEDYQGEYRSGTRAWDIRDLRMSVYVRPIANYFNTNNKAVFLTFPGDAVRVEFSPRGVIGYEVGGGSSPGLSPLDSDPIPELKTALRQTAAEMAGNQSFRTEVAKFSHAYLHTQFWNEIGQTNTVSLIEISDGFFFPHTQPGLGVAVVSIQVADINLNTEPGGEEIRVNVYAAHAFRGLAQVDWPGRFNEFEEIDNHQSTPFTTIGVFSLEGDCPQLESIWYSFGVTEIDPIINDIFWTQPAWDQVSLECGTLNELFSAGQFGLASEERRDGYLLLQGEDVRGALSALIRVYVYRR